MTGQYRWTTLFFTACIAAVGAGLVLPVKAQAASCSDEIDRTQIVVDAALFQRANTVRSAPETTFAKLGYQPTPATIASAENEYGGWVNGSKAIAALRRARAAEAAGNVRTCRAELRAARRAIARP